MEEQYKGDIIRVTTEKDNSAFLVETNLHNTGRSITRGYSTNRLAAWLRHARSSQEGRTNNLEKMD
jgi:hypothetical protein